jgi:hypothetical protein
MNEKDWITDQVEDDETWNWVPAYAGMTKKDWFPVKSPQRISSLRTPKRRTTEENSGFFTETSLQNGATRTPCTGMTKKKK